WLLVWVTYFACRILDTDQKAPAATYVGFAVSLGFALGTKVFAIAYPGYLVALILAAAMTIYLRSASPDDGKYPLRALIPFLWALPLAFCVAVMFWPWVIQSPDNLANALTTFLRFPHEVPVLWEGRTFDSTQPPFAYLVVSLGLKLPELVLIALVFAV